MLLRRIKHAILGSRIVTRCQAAGDAVALTFDDGPDSRFTPTVLESLERAGARATFFLVGDAARRNPDLVRRICEEGHEIGNHSMTHADLSELDYIATCREFDATHALLEELSSRQSYSGLLRPPKGRVTLHLVRYCQHRQRRIILWDRDPRDFAAYSGDDILNTFREDPLHSGSVILLHDKAQQTVDALPALLDHVARRQLNPVTVSQLLRSAIHSSRHTASVLPLPRL